MPISPKTKNVLTVVGVLLGVTCIAGAVVVYARGQKTAAYDIDDDDDDYAMVNRDQPDDY